MASTVFDVTPEVIKASANKIEGETKEFIKDYQDIYNAVADLRVTYKGEASDTFNKRIEGYKNDFAKAEKTLKEYVQFLREYAAKMNRTETDIKGKADALPVGK